MHIDTKGHRLHNPGSCLAHNENENQDQANADKQAVQSADTAGKNDPVIDLQHKHGNRQGKQVHEERHGQHFAECRLQRLQNFSEPGFCFLVTHELRDYNPQNTINPVNVIALHKVVSFYK